MKTAFIFLAMVTLSTAQLIYLKYSDKNLDNLWYEYKSVFGKIYQTEEDAIIRRLIWEKNINRITTHNFEYDLGHHSYRLGISEFTDMRDDEFRKVMSGLRFTGENDYNSSVVFVDEDVSDLPRQVDWRKKGYVTDVKNQGHCGSCWAFAATGSLEGQIYDKTGKLVSLSEQDLIDCADLCGNYGCDGGLVDPAFECIMKLGGIESGGDYPYKAKNDKCRFSRKKSVTTLSSYVGIKRFSEKALQKAVATIGPVSVAIDASDFRFELYEEGIFESSTCSSTELNHGVLVVGYGTEYGKDYWLVKNSWGTTWGMEGYFKMARNHNNMCGIASLASYPVL